MEYLVMSSTNEQATNLLGEVLSELKYARAKFPNPDGNFAAFIEEVGELGKAIIEEPKRNVKAEAIQCVVMAMRIVLDGDPTYDKLREDRKLEKL